jgi:hypothetical protein
MHIQLWDALGYLEEAIRELTPLPWHNDQLLKATA